MKFKKELINQIQAKNTHIFTGIHNLALDTIR